MKSMKMPSDPFIGFLTTPPHIYMYFTKHFEVYTLVIGQLFKILRGLM